MQKRFFRAILGILSILAFSFFPLPLGASTVAPPQNLGQLARLSKAVVFAQALESWSEEGGAIPFTVTRFQLLEKVAGADPGLIFEVREPGGRIGDRGAVIAGAPQFTPESRYLLFLDPAPDGRWRSRMLAYGLLEEARDGALKPLPEANAIEVRTKSSVEPVGVYRKAELLAHLKEVARGARWNRERVEASGNAQGALLSVHEALHNDPAGCAWLLSPGDNLPIRWFGFETGSATVTVSPTNPGQTGIADGGVSAVQQGTASWTNHPDSVIRLSTGSTQPVSISCTASFDLDDNAVVFNDPCNDIADLSGCVGTLGIGGTLFSNSTQTFDGEPWHPALGTYVVINNGAQCVGDVNFREVVAHELGHTQGFNHHNPPNPADALMSAMLKADGLGPALRATDKRCASYAYHTFTDVPYNNTFWRFIEAIENAGITSGCGTALYCPDNLVTRAEMAVFLVRGAHGSAFVPPPATGTIFNDVPASHWAARYIEQLYKDGITKGCSTGFYCPGDLVKRSEMAVFLTRNKHGSSFVPPPATGTVFADVPASYWAASYIEQVYNDGVTSGCATNPTRYCPEDYVSRDQMAAFLARSLGLPLP